METINRFSLRLLPKSLALSSKHLKPTTFTPIFRPAQIPAIRKPELLNPIGPQCTTLKSFSSSSVVTQAAWLLGLGENKKKTSLPEIVKAGDPVLHEQAREVDPEEIPSERMQNMIDDMVKAMRTAPGVGLAAPQIGIPLRVSGMVNLETANASTNGVTVDC